VNEPDGRHSDGKSSEGRYSDGRYSDGRYLEANPGWHLEDAPWKAEQALALLRTHGLQPRRIVEVGCGAGEVLRRVHAALGPGTEADGWEPSPQAAALAQSRAAPGLRFHAAPLPPVPSGPPADLLLALDVAEHVEDCIGFLRSLRPHARHALFHVPLDLSVQTVVRATPLQVARAQVGHLHFFTRETALATLAHAGWQVQAERYTAGSLDLPPRGWRGRVARWPRRLAFALSPHAAVRWLGGFSLLVLAQPD